MPIFLNSFLLLDFFMSLSSAVLILKDPLSFYESIALQASFKLTQLESYLLNIYAVYLLCMGVLALRIAFTRNTDAKIYYCQSGTLRSILILYFLNEQRSFFKDVNYKLSVLITVSFLVFHFYFGFFYSEETFWSAEEYEAREKQKLKTN